MYLKNIYLDDICRTLSNRYALYGIGYVKRFECDK